MISLAHNTNTIMAITKMAMAKIAMFGLIHNFYRPYHACKKDTKDCLIFFNYVFERILFAFRLENFTCTWLFTQNFLKCKKNKIELESLIVYTKNVSLKLFLSLFWLVTPHLLLTNHFTSCRLIFQII